jgi:hypothetical protein
MTEPAGLQPNWGSLPPQLSSASYWLPHAPDRTAWQPLSQSDSELGPPEHCAASTFGQTWAQLGAAPPEPPEPELPPPLPPPGAEPLPLLHATSSAAAKIDPQRKARIMSRAYREPTRAPSRD